MKRIYFLLFGLTGLAGLVGQFVYFPNLIDYFSLFTILSNIFVTAVFLYLGINPNKLPKNFNFFLGATATYIIVTAIGYWVFLRDEPVAVPWINIVLHLVMPLAALVGWFTFKHLNHLKYLDALKWLSFPLIYLAYVLIRNFFTGWSPYHFLDPEKVGGYGGVFIYVTIFSLLTVLIGAGTVFINNMLAETK